MKTKKIIPIVLIATILGLTSISYTSANHHGEEATERAKYKAERMEMKASHKADMIGM